MSARTRSGYRAPKIPAKLGAVADALFKLREERRELERVAEDMKAHEAALRDRIIESLPKSDATGVAGRLARATITTKSVPTVKDWDALCAHVKKTGEFDLLHRRVSASAAAERWDDDEEIPGVERFVVVDVSLSKLGGKG